MGRIKVLHCADVHIGAIRTAIGIKAKGRKEEVLQTFLSIIDLCKKENVQLLLIAGDLFDVGQADEATLDAIEDSFAKIPETIIAIAPGNHDCITADSPYLTRKWSKNIIIFKSKNEKIELSELGVYLYGGAFEGVYETNSFMPQAENNEKINICVIHGDLCSGTSNYNPISEKQIAESKMDYIALGHIHKQTDILKSGKTFYAYSGCPEGQGFDELGEKGVYIGYVGKGVCEMEYKRMGRRIFAEEHITLETGDSNSRAEKILEVLKEKYGESYGENLYKIVIEGETEPDFAVNTEAISAAIRREVYFCKVKDNTSIKLDNLKEIAEESSLRGIFVRIMLGKIDRAKQSEIETYKNALKIGLKAFEGEVGYSED